MSDVPTKDQHAEWCNYKHGRCDCGASDQKPREWLIRKRGYYYRPNRSGYTVSVAEAGRYTEAEAKSEAAIEPSIMSAVHQSEVGVMSSNPDNESDYQRMARLIMKERPGDSASVRDRSSDSVPSVDSTDRLGMLARAVYVTSGQHLSGYRLILGFETREEVSAAHQAIADIKRGAVETAAPIDPRWDEDPENPETQCVPAGARYKLSGYCDKCRREWIVTCQTGTEVTVKAFHCSCGHVTEMDGRAVEPTGKENLGPEAPGGVGVIDLAARSPKRFRQTSFCNSGPGDRCDHCQKPLSAHSDGMYYCSEKSDDSVWIPLASMKQVKAGDKCAHCGNEWLTSLDGNGIWHNCHTGLPLKASGEQS